MRHCQHAPSQRGKGIHEHHLTYHLVDPVRLDVYLGQGRCVSCHTIGQTHALFTDNAFHNLGVGFKALGGREFAVALEFTHMLSEHEEADELVLAEKRFSELGRYAVTKEADAMGAFKTPTLRNVAKTAPYMHDGSLATLEEVVVWYNFGGRISADDPVTPFLDVDPPAESQ